MSTEPLRFKDLKVGDVFRLASANFVRISKTPIGSGIMNAAGVGEGGGGFTEFPDDCVVHRAFVNDGLTATIAQFNEYMDTPRGEHLRNLASRNGFEVVYQHGQPGLEIEKSQQVVCCFEHPNQMFSFIRGLHTGLEWFNLDGDTPVAKPEWLAQLKRDAETRRNLSAPPVLKEMTE